MRRTVPLLIALATLSAVSAPASLARPRPSPPLRHLATVPEDTRIVSDGRTLLVTQPDGHTLRTYDLATGATRDLRLTEQRCELYSAAAGRALVVCGGPLYYPYSELEGARIIDLRTGAVTEVPVAPNALGATAGELGGLGRYWISGSYSDGSVHPIVTAFYVEIATGRIVLGHRYSSFDEEAGIGDRIRNLDTPNLRLLACGPSWGEAYYSAAPYFVRGNGARFWIDRCQDGRLTRETRVTQSPTRWGYVEGMSRQIVVAEDKGRATAWRTRDGARLGHWVFPRFKSRYVDLQASAVGSHVVLVRFYPGYYQKIDVADAFAHPPATKRPRLVIRPGRGMDLAMLGMKRASAYDDQREAIGDDFGPGRPAGHLRLYGDGVARLAIAFDQHDRAARISTSWPGATLRGHRLGLGLTRLDRRLPNSWRMTCGCRALVHGDGPATILRRTAGETVKATVTAAAPMGCAAR